MKDKLRVRLVAEFLGTALLVAAVGGFGVMALSAQEVRDHSESTTGQWPFVFPPSLQ